MLCPVDRISNGYISLQISHVSGPHDHPKPATNVHVKSTTTIAEECGIGTLPLETLTSFSVAARIDPITIY